MDPGNWPYNRILVGLPRLRGDGPVSTTALPATREAPPPTRGWTVGRTSRLVGVFGSPAYAGMDPSSGTNAASRTGLPRLRGDGPTARVGTR